MEKEIVDNIMYKVNELMKEFTNAKIEYLLINKQNTENSIALMIDNKDNELYEVKLRNKGIYAISDWSYNIDEDFFEYLENEYEIGFISLEWNYNIWCHLEADIKEFEHKLGIQKYLKYCKENNINKKTLEKGVNMKITDIMQYYDKKTDYMKIENGQVQLPQEEYQKENVISYISFCLGYDLLNNKLSESEKSECDNVYDFCNHLAKKFIETEYYKNTCRSTYDNLKEWLEDNKEIIQSQYLYYLEKDNKRIIETVKRNNDKVALVEQHLEDGTKEYIVAFNYEVDNEKVKWVYGYNYSNDLNKAKEEFKKVKAEEDLANDTKTKNRKKKKERNIR